MDTEGRPVVGGQMVGVLWQLQQRRDVIWPGPALLGGVWPGPDLQAAGATLCHETPAPARLQQ